MNVYEAGQLRISKAFDAFGYVYVSFSGGKDSGVLLNMVAAEAKRRGIRFGIFHMDYECQYQMTTDYVAATLDSFADVADIYHVCVPFKVTTCTSMYQSYWRPWEESKRNIWVRPMPERALSGFPFFRETQWDYDFQVAFGAWLANEKRCSVCCMVGIRTQESLNRWRAIFSDRNYKNHNGWRWTKDMENGVVNAYPIYDFTTEDVWIANARNGWSYNHLYDLYYQAGVNIDQMRVASPFISEGQESLKLYRVIEPPGKIKPGNGSEFRNGTTARGGMIPNRDILGAIYTSVPCHRQRENATLPNLKHQSDSGVSAEDACQMAPLPSCVLQALISKWRINQIMPLTKSL